MPDESPLDTNTRVFTYISPGGWATRRLSDVRPEPPVPNPLVAWHVGEPKSAAYEGQGFRVVDTRRLPADLVWEVQRCASRLWWRGFDLRRAICDAFGVPAREIGLAGRLPTPPPAADPDLLALAVEADGLARRLHDIYNTLRPAHPYSYSKAIEARDALEELAEQLRDDALDFHPDVQGSDG